jgi:hypothetical protein
MPTNTPDDEPVTCRVCGKPFAPGEPRYRDEEGDVHPECYKRPRRPPEAVIGSHRPSTTGLTVPCRVFRGYLIPHNLAPVLLLGVQDRCKSS